VQRHLQRDARDLQGRFGRGVKSVSEHRREAPGATVDRPASATVRRVRAVLLDIDGTLIDSNDAHAQAWVDTFREVGREDVPFERVRPLIGMGSDKLLPTVSGVEKESDEGKRLTDLRSKIFLERYLPTLRPFPKARDLLERLRDDGLTLVVATSANEKEMKALLDRAGVADLVEDTTTSSDAEHSKPDPDIVHAALDRAGHPAAETLMLGDTPYDMESAGRAGVALIAFRCGGWWTDDDLAGAAAIYDGPEELLAEYDGSPFAKAGSGE
jgi:HAD superfamily hydrolase (TIGR01509 family)